jgi:hypothetical protein
MGIRSRLQQPTTCGDVQGILGDGTPGRKPDDSECQPLMHPEKIITTSPTRWSGYDVAPRWAGDQAPPPFAFFATFCSNLSLLPSVSSSLPMPCCEKQEEDLYQFLVPATSIICCAKARSADFENATVPNFNSLPSELRTN